MGLYKEMRARFANMDVQTLISTIEEYRQDQELLVLALSEEDLEARKRKQLENEKVREVYERILSAERHQLLEVQVPEGVDREHVQAILMYGFLAPGRGITACGARFICYRNYRSNVARKLLNRYSDEKAHCALTFLLNNGVLHPLIGGKANDRACSFNTDEHLKAVTPVGLSIIKAAKSFLFQS